MVRTHQQWLYGLLLSLMAFCSQVSAINITPSPSYSGSYSVSWSTATDKVGECATFPGPDTFLTCVELYEKANGGVWTATNVSSGSTTVVYNGKAIGSYEYRLQERFCAGVTPILFPEGFCLDWAVVEAPVTLQVIAPTVPTGLTGPLLDHDGSYLIS